MDEITIAARTMCASLARLGKGPATAMVITWPSGQVSVTACTGDPSLLEDTYRQAGCKVARWADLAAAS